MTTPALRGPEVFSTIAFCAIALSIYACQRSGSPGNSRDRNSASGMSASANRPASTAETRRDPSPSLSSSTGSVDSTALQCVEGGGEVGNGCVVFVTSEIGLLSCFQPRSSSDSPRWVDCENLVNIVGRAPAAAKRLMPEYPGYAADIRSGQLFSVARDHYHPRFADVALVSFLRRENLQEVAGREMREGHVRRVLEMLYDVASGDFIGARVEGLFFGNAAPYELAIQQ